MKILIVDDEPDVEMLFRQKFRKELKKGDLDLVFAFSGREALEVLGAEDPPKVMYVFSDINMPGLTGLELLERVKAKYPTIHVSMISAYGDQENYDRAMRSGAKEFFTKPIDFSSLKEEINQVVSE